jgi:hypothetical protein
VSDDMQSEMEAIRQRLDEQGQPLNDVESKLERLRAWIEHKLGPGKY